MKTFYPIDLLNKRLEIAKEDSDTSMFLHLMYAGEQLTKIVTVALVACVEDDKLRHRYAQEHRLVRADGIGEWSSCIDEILSGVTSQFLCIEMRGFQKELLEAKKEGSWQYDSVKLLNECLKIVDKKADALPVKTQARNWYSIFARLRNKARAHGALGMNDCSALCPLLENSLKLQYENLSILSFPWVFLKRNLNGKYHVSTISSTSTPFEYLKSDRNQFFEDGVYLHAGKHRFVRLLYSTAEINDFYYPNGFFGKNTFECLSYITDDKIHHDVSPF